MARFFKWLLLLPIIVIGLALALANRQPTTIYFDPFPNGGVNGPQISAPFFLILFVALMVGVVIGGVATWVGQGASRRAARSRQAARSSTRWRDQARKPAPASSIAFVPLSAGNSTEVTPNCGKILFKRKSVPP